MKNLESRSLSYVIVEEFLLDLKEEFGEEDDKTNKDSRTKEDRAGNKMMKKFV